MTSTAQPAKSQTSIPSSSTDKVTPTAKTAQSERPPAITSISIKDLIHRGQSGAQEEKKGEGLSISQQPVVNTTDNQPIIESNLNSSWKKYITSLEKDNLSLWGVVNDKVPTVVDQQNIVIKVETVFQESELNKNRDEIVHYLRNSLKNNLLQLQVVVEKSETDAPAKIYTAADKLNAMMQKNPALKTLKEKFNLDLT